MPCTCSTRASLSVVRIGFGCRGMLVAGLIIAFISGVQSGPCSSQTISVNVTTSGDVQRLMDAMNCSGEADFNVAWYSTLQLYQRIVVANNKHLEIVGFGYPTVSAMLYSTNESQPAVEAADTKGMFSVSNRSTLTISHMVLHGGCSNDGGAVVVHSSSLLYVNDCIFTGNRADSGGEMIRGKHCHRCGASGGNLWINSDL